MKGITMSNTKNVELKGAGEYGLDSHLYESLTDEVLEEYLYIADENFLNGFIAGMNFFLVPKGAETHGTNVCDYFSNALRNVNEAKSKSKSGSSFEILGAVGSILGWN